MTSPGFRPPPSGWEEDWPWWVLLAILFGWQPIARFGWQPIARIGSQCAREWLATYSLNWKSARTMSNVVDQVLPTKNDRQSMYNSGCGSLSGFFTFGWPIRFPSRIVGNSYSGLLSFLAREVRFVSSCNAFDQYSESIQNSHGWWYYFDTYYTYLTPLQHTYSASICLCKLVC